MTAIQVRVSTCQNIFEEPRTSNFELRIRKSTLESLNFEFKLRIRSSNLEFEVRASSLNFELRVRSLNIEFEAQATLRITNFLRTSDCLSNSSVSSSSVNFILISFQFDLDSILNVFQLLFNIFQWCRSAIDYYQQFLVSWELWNCNRVTWLRVL